MFSYKSKISKWLEEMFQAAPGMEGKIKYHQNSIDKYKLSEGLDFESFNKKAMKKNWWEVQEQCTSWVERQVLDRL